MVETFQSEHLLLIMAQTPIHAGVGSSVQPVDLPIQRDVVSDFPIIRGGELRGSLAQQLFEKFRRRPLWDKLRSLIFGFAGERTRAGSFDILDAHILLFPTPSLYGAYAHLISPLLLHRFSLRANRTMPSLARAVGELAKSYSEKFGEYKVIVEKGSKIVSKEGAVYLHPLLRFEAEQDERLNKLSSLLAGKFENLGLKVQGHLALLDDDSALYVIKHSTILQPRVRLDYKKKTVGVGPWWEELMPRYTILHTLVIIPRGKRFHLEVSREEGDELVRLVNELLPKLNFMKLTIRGVEEGEAYKVELESDKVLNLFLPDERSSLFLGGNTTIGKGLLRIVRVR